MASRASDAQLALVTGGAGFIGSHLVRALLARGVKVRVLDDLSTGDRARLADTPAELIVGDIREPEAVEAAMQGVQWVYHLAAEISVPESEQEPARCYETNVGGSLNVLRAASAAGAERVVLASSAAIYGEADDPVAEDARPQPHSPYAASKLMMENAGALFHQQYGLPVVSLRFFNIYGPGQPVDSAYAAVIPAFIQAQLAGRPLTIYGSGEQQRDFVYVADAVRACLQAAERQQAIGQVANIGSGQPVSVNSLARILQDAEREHLQPVYESERAGDIFFSQAVIERAEQLLGFAPRVELSDGLASTVEWFRLKPPGNP